MREFFHGWRRKVGVATLVIACAIAGFWMATGDHQDGVSFQLRQRQYVFYSVGGQIVCLEMPAHGGFWRLSSDDYEPMRSIVAKLEQNWGEISQYKDFAVKRRAIPLWGLLLPLTLLSAYLILWKPRKRG